MKQTGQMSETIRMGIVLALAGGFMDAYSYCGRGKVFANAQTGNMLLFGISVAERQWQTALRYAVPVLAFAAGIAVADIVREKTNNRPHFHWRQMAVLAEIFVFLIVSMIPEGANLAANSLTSFACGIQVESFRKIRGNGIATTMCIGNLRSATQNVCEYWFHRDKETAKKGILYYGIIFCFVVGAVLGNFFVKMMQTKAILVCAGILAVAFCMMFVEKKEEIQP